MIKVFYCPFNSQFEIEIQLIFNHRVDCEGRESYVNTTLIDEEATFFFFKGQMVLNSFMTNSEVFFLRKWGYGTQSIFFKTSKVAFWFKLRFSEKATKIWRNLPRRFYGFFQSNFNLFLWNIRSWKTLLSNLSIQILIKYRKVDKAWKILYSFYFYKVCFFHCTISTGYSLSDQHNILPVNPKY